MLTTKAELEELYIEEGMSLREVGERYGVTATAVSGWLQLFGIPRRNKSEARLLALQKGKFKQFDYHSFNRGLFKERNPRSVYLLGLAMADGHLTKGGTLNFTFGKRSKELTYNIVKLMGSDKEPVEFKNNGYPAWRIAFSSTEMRDDLVMMGLPTGHKSITKPFPDLPEGLESHFVRGYFDGNGSVTLSSSLIRFHTGSEKFVNGLRDCIAICLERRFGGSPTGGTIAVDEKRVVSGLNGGVIERKHPAYTLIYASLSDRTNLYHWFYDDAPPYTWLERKRAKWAEMIGM